MSIESVIQSLATSASANFPVSSPLNTPSIANGESFGALLSTLFTDLKPTLHAVPPIDGPVYTLPIDPPVNTTPKDPGVSIPENPPVTIDPATGLPEGMKLQPIYETRIIPVNIMTPMGPQTIQKEITIIVGMKLVPIDPPVSIEPPPPPRYPDPEDPPVSIEPPPPPRYPDPNNPPYHILPVDPVDLPIYLDPRESDPNFGITPNPNDPPITIDPIESKPVDPEPPYHILPINTPDTQPVTGLPEGWKLVPKYGPITVMGPNNTTKEVIVQIGVELVRVEPETTTSPVADTTEPVASTVTIDPATGLPVGMRLEPVYETRIIPIEVRTPEGIKILQKEIKIIVGMELVPIEPQTPPVSEPIPMPSPIIPINGLPEGMKLEPIYGTRIIPIVVMTPEGPKTIQKEIRIIVGMRLVPIEPQRKDPPITIPGDPRRDPRTGPITVPGFPDPDYPVTID